MQYLQFSNYLPYDKTYSNGSFVYSFFNIQDLYNQMQEYSWIKLIAQVQ